MANDTSTVSPTPYEAPEAARPYLALARQGKEAWNRWIRTGMNDRQAEEFGLAEVAPLSADEARELAQACGLDGLPGYDEAPNFEDVDFEHGRPIDFSGFIFAPSRRRNTSRGPLGMKIEGDAAVLFRCARFGLRTGFAGATFADMAIFDGAIFDNLARFDDAKFGDRAKFDGATFHGVAVFSGARFGDGASFVYVTFGGPAFFADAVLGVSAEFSGATFGSGASFMRAVFGQGASFDGKTKEAARETLGDLLRFLYGVSASKRVKLRLADWDETAAPDQFHAIDFSGVRFLGTSSFRNRTFTSSVDFNGAVFHEPPEFAGGEGFGHLDLGEINISFGGRRWWRPRNWTTSSNVDARLRRLRKIAKDVEAHDLERDLFILERHAQRGIQFVRLFRRFDHPWAEVWNRGRIDRAKLGDNVRGRNPLRPLGLMLLLFFYDITSDCGRSMLRPLLWFLASLAGFHAVYRSLLHAARGKLLPFTDADLISYTLGNALPFVGNLSPARRDIFLRLFGVPKEDGSRWPFLSDLLAHLAGPPERMIQVPPPIEVLSYGQSILGTVLLFLFLLAVRNRFRIG